MRHLLPAALTLLACTPPAPPTGGPCTYDESPGLATITSIAPASAPCDAPCAPCLTVRARLTDDTGRPLPQDFVLHDHASQAGLDAAGWSVGAAIPGTVRQRATGTCTPLGFVPDEVLNDDAVALCNDARVE